MNLTDDLRELGQLLVTASNGGGQPLRSVVVDAAKLVTPGCWLRVDSIRMETLAASHTVATTVHLVVPDSDPERAHTRLSALFTALRPTLETVGYSGADIAFTGLLIPGSSTPLPALAIPVELHITEEEG